MTASCRAKRMRCPGIAGSWSLSGRRGNPRMAPNAASSGSWPTAAACFGDVTATTIGSAIPVAQSSPPAGSLECSSSAAPGTPTVVTDASAAAQPAPATSVWARDGVVGKCARGVDDIKRCSRASREPHQMVGLSRILTTFILSSSDKRTDPQLRRHQPDQTPGEPFLERVAMEVPLVRRMHRHNQSLKQFHP